MRLVYRNRKILPDILLHKCVLLNTCYPCVYKASRRQAENLGFVVFGNHRRPGFKRKPIIFPGLYQNNMFTLSF
jgi:hypothetical protein